MKDINYVIKILEKHNISNAEYARNIGSTRQNVHNWINGNGIPKYYLNSTAKYLSKLTKKKVTIDSLFSFCIENDTKTTPKNTNTKG